MRSKKSPRASRLPLSASKDARSLARSSAEGESSSSTVPMPPTPDEMPPRRLIVNWQCETTRAILPVAELVETTVQGAGERFEFGYLEGVREAMTRGFQPFLAFPELDRRYASASLFPFFKNRVLPTTRPDYVDYVTALGLSVETANVVELLGRSEGRRQTDRIETVLAAERDPRTGGYVTHFLARGVRHLAGAEAAILALSAGEILTVTVDATNPKNPRARLLGAGGASIGFVPEYLLADVERLDLGAVAPTFTVERVNPPPHPAHHRVLVRLDAPWPGEFEPFQAAPFQRYRPDADERLAG